MSQQARCSIPRKFSALVADDEPPKVLEPGKESQS
jgi:hypothetical protein